MPEACLDNETFFSLSAEQWDDILNSMEPLDLEQSPPTLVFNQIIPLTSLNDDLFDELMGENILRIPR